MRQRGNRIIRMVVTTVFTGKSSTPLERRPARVIWQLIRRQQASNILRWLQLCPMVALLQPGTMSITLISRRSGLPQTERRMALASSRSTVIHQVPRARRRSPASQVGAMSLPGRITAATMAVRELMSVGRFLPIAERRWVKSFGSTPLFTVPRASRR